MNTIETARENFITASRHCYFSPTCPTFTKPNAKNGYGAVLMLLSNGSMPSRAAILKKLGLPVRNGYYAAVFQKLLWSKLITYHCGVGYAISELGKRFIAENFFNSAKRPSAPVAAAKPEPSEDANAPTPSWLPAYNAAMEAYKAAMEAYQVAISAFA